VHLRHRNHRTAVLGGLALAGLLAATVTGCSRGRPDEATASAATIAGLPGAYLTIGDKLAHDDIAALDRDAAKVVAELEALGDEPGAHTMLAAAGRVGAKDIDTAREAFRKLSLGLLEYLRAHPQAREGLIVVHCPMTFEGEGAAWVQRDGPVMNPYEGSMMLHCGDQVDWSWKPETDG